MIQIKSFKVRHYIGPVRSACAHRQKSGPHLSPESLCQLSISESKLEYVQMGPFKFCS